MKDDRVNEAGTPAPKTSVAGKDHAGLDRPAVLLVACCEPECPQDLPPYIHDINFNGQTPQALIDEIARRYQLIGEQSPLTGYAESLAQKLSRVLEIPVYVTRRCWRPGLSEVVSRIQDTGAQRLIVLCLNPQYSDLTVGSYWTALEEITTGSDQFPIDFIDCWHTRPDFVRAVSGHLLDSLKRFDPAEVGRVKVAFVAATLPRFILDRGDPYYRQLRETARLIAATASIPDSRWTLAFLSPLIRSSVPWLGPPVCDLVKWMAAEDEQNLVVVPIGFVLDHLGTLYDVDLALQETARSVDVRVERVAMLNDGDALVKILTGVLRERLAAFPASPEIRVHHRSATEWV